MTVVVAIGVSAGAWPAERADVSWAIDRRALEFTDWRERLAVGPGGEVWLGGQVAPGTAVPGSSRGLLYRRTGEEWVAWRSAELAGARTYVLDVDPTGALWVCAYSPTEEATYGGLRIQRYDGRRWSEQTVTPGIWPQTMDMVSSREGWIGGNHGNLLHYTGGKWRRELLDLDEPARHGLNILALRMLGPEEGWAVGSQGLVARYRAGHWRTVQVPEPMRSQMLYDLDVTEDGHLWVVGTGGLIARYDGSSWRRLASPTDQDLLGVDLVSPVDGWAVGKHGTILRYDGNAWQLQPSPTIANLHDIAMASPAQGWIAADDAVLRTTARPRFLLRDAAGQESLPMAGPPGTRAAAVDADGDGDLDLFTLQATSIRMYDNLGAGRFVGVAGPAMPPASRGVASLHGMAWGDVDGDGDPDLLALGERPALAWLYQNLGRGRFAAPEPLSPEPLGGAGDSAWFLDLEQDGDLDLYLARSASPGPHHLANLDFRNDGWGRLQLQDASTGKNSVEMLALWGDLDGDLDLDGILPGDGNELELLLNEGGRLRQATAGSGLDAPLGRGQMFQGHLLDLDIDGDLDLLLLGDRLYVFRNLAGIDGGRVRFQRDDGLFEPVSHNPTFNLRMSNAGDLDHDGFPEVLLHPVVDGRAVVRLFSRGPDGRYRDVAGPAGLADLTGHGAVFADWDGDGDLDLYLVGDSESHFLENLRDDAGFLKVRPRGARSNRLAVGARVRVYEAGHLGEPAFLRGHQQAGVGFNPTGVQGLGELHFGVDPRGRYDVEVVFPGGSRSVARGVAPGSTLSVVEGAPGVRQLWLALGWARRTWRAADPWRELAKLVLVVCALVLWRGAARRLGARLLVRRWSLSAALLAVYLLTAGYLAPDRRGSAHAGHLAGFGATLVLLAAFDRRLTGWKESRYLGPYRLLGILGEGGMGVVHRARHVVSGRTVALKVLHPRRTGREEDRLRFLREAGLLTRLEHPNIVRVLETGEIGGRGYISMELLAGMSLRRLVERQGPLPPAVVAGILAAACRALAYIHRQGIVHRDVKSDNLFLLEPEAALRAGADGWEERVKLMDFGLARAAGMATVTTHKALLGTLAYIPPEQLRGRDCEPRSDLYSLGVVAFEALTSRLPFEAGDEGSLLARVQAGGPPPLDSLRPGIPAALDDLVRRMLAREPGERPASAEELEAVLVSLAHGVPSEAGICCGREPETGAPEVLPKEPTRSGSQGDGWRRRLEEARRRLAEGHATEAQVLMVECLAELREVLVPLDPGRQERYCRQNGVAEALDLMRRLSNGDGR